MRALVVRLAVVVLSLSGLLAGGVAEATHSRAATCSSGWVCLVRYAGGSWSWYHYGAHNLTDVYGEAFLYNHQTGGAVAYACTGYNGTGRCTLVPAGQTLIRDFTPINSIYLAAHAT